MLRSVDCNEKFYFYCGTPQEEKPLCPINYFYHKGNQNQNYYNFISKSMYVQGLFFFKEFGIKLNQ